MTEIERIRDQLRRVREGDAWHGPSLREVLREVSAETASARPVPAAHTIWELVLHMTTWADAVRRRLEGERVSPTAEEDWPRVGDASEAGWQAALDRLERAHAELDRTIAGLADDGLDQPPKGSPSTRYVLLHGVIQHDVWHAGQIAIVKKAVG